MFFGKKRAASSAALIAGAPGRDFATIEKFRGVRTGEQRKEKGPRFHAPRGNACLAAPAARRAESYHRGETNMRFWIREIMGWLLVGLGLFVFYMCVVLLFNHYI